jgi:3-oxoacyl-[acyl-carrier protein] reductase
MADELTLKGRSAIVTGAGNGLGRAESLALARAGVLLVLNDTPGDAIADTAGQVRSAGGQAVVCEGDIGDWETGRRLVGAALDAYGRLDILLNNAGVLRDRMIFSMSGKVQPGEAVILSTFGAIIGRRPGPGRSPGWTLARTSR